MFKVFGCVGPSPLHRLLSSCSEQDLLSSYDVQASHCAGSLVVEARALGP